MEALEGRQLLSAAPHTTPAPHFVPAPVPPGLTPTQVRHAYGFDRLSLTDRWGHRVDASGVGQTIAIIDAYDDPNIQNDFKVFSARYGLRTVDGQGKPLLAKVRLGHGRTLAPSDAGWSQEIAMDVEWAHAIAPSAHILLVESASTSVDDMVAAVRYAQQQPSVVAVSMSWSGPEFGNETRYDSVFTTPAGHLGSGFVSGGITYVVAAGDDSAPAGWPAVSPNVVSVGGTSLALRNGEWAAESGWMYGGGGLSYYEKEPSYQNALSPNAGGRTAPDVAYNANPSVGYSVYDSVPYHGKVGWQSMGGTSAGAPQWAALVAIADEGRQLLGKRSLDGRTQTLPALYSIPASHFHDITSGNNGYLAAPGFDAVTGRGSPHADKVIFDLLWV